MHFLHLFISITISATVHLVQLATAQLLTSNKVVASTTEANPARNSGSDAGAACEFPLASTLLFSDMDGNLTYLDSSSNMTGESSFPYQYVILNCSASYPVEWVWESPEILRNLSQPYYYSYVLDDEVRKGDEFVALLHIGNETLANGTIKNLTVACKPVPVMGENHGQACGKTQFLLRKETYYEKPWNITKLVVSFQEETLPNGNDVVPVEKDLCLRDEMIAQNNSKPNFTCRSPEWPFSGSISTGSFSPHFDFNITDFNLPFGVRDLKCTSALEKNPNKTEEQLIIRVPYYFSLPKLCPNEDSTLSHLYFRRSSSDSCQTSDLVNEDELLSLCVQNSAPQVNDFYVGDNVNVICISSIYYFAQGMQIYSDNSGEDKSVALISNASRERSYGQNGYRNISTSFQIENNTAHEIRCMAPVRKSRKWVTKSVVLEVKVPEKVSFDGSADNLRTEGPDTFLLCNASGLPLPLLTWSRLNNEPLPTNQSTQIQTFSTSPENDSTANTTWISSKLFMPTTGKPETELMKYHGRYICTSTNRFESLEKIFLFDGNGGREESAIFRTVGRTVWFWILVTVAMFGMLGLVAVLGWKVHRQTNRLRLFSKAEIDEFVFGKPELLLDDSDNYEEINSYAAYLPYDRKGFEIRREQLEFNPTDILGCGAYGTVYKGVFIQESGERTPVAVKTVNSTSDKMYFAALLSEIKIMCYIGEEENVVRLVGACTKYLDRRQIYVAMEYCENGDLLSYIQKNREVFINNAGREQLSLIGDEIGLGVKSFGLRSAGDESYCRLSHSGLLLKPQLLLVWAMQIAKGMAFLSSKKVIHGDLAARNILLDSNLQPKIGDFGLSKQLQKYANYVQKGNDLVPWRWLAIESLQFMKFSLKSDVWAFGVVLWEMLTLGQVPWPAYSYSELFIVALCQGERLTKPTFASNKMYGLMLECWRNSPEERPTFTALKDELKELMLEETTNKSLENGFSPSPNQNHDDQLRPPQLQETNPYVHTQQICQKRGLHLTSPNTISSSPPTSSYVTDWTTVS